MSDTDPTDLFSEFDDGPPDISSDGLSDAIEDPLIRLDAASLLESLSSSDLIPDFGAADEVPPAPPIFEEPPLKELLRICIMKLKIVEIHNQGHERGCRRCYSSSCR